MIEKIMKELEARLTNCKNEVFPYTDLNMNNGDEVSVEAPSTWENGCKDYTILTDSNEVIHCPNLRAVAVWIYGKYCVR